jgi:hypothetical protein
MAEYEVTGVRYRMGDGLTIEESTPLAEAFIKGLKVGTPVTLLADGTNPDDRNAIAVFREEKHVGYISKTRCEAVLPLLDDDGRCEAKVSGNDGHVTFFIEIENATEACASPMKRERQLPVFPLQRTVHLNYLPEEMSLMAFAPQVVRFSLDEKSPTLLEDVKAYIEKVEKFIPLSGLSFCIEDNLWRDDVLKMLRKACRLQLPDREKEQLNQLRIRLSEVVGDFHSCHEDVQLRIFERQLEMLKKQAEGKEGLFWQYERSLDGEPTETERLTGWFKEMPDIRLYDYHDRKVLVRTLNYLRITRRELYDVYAALLLIGRYGGEEDEEPQAAEKEEKNYIAPTRNLQRLLKEDWFKECRTDGKYNAKWISGFVEALMESEWKDLIADEWSVKDKRLMLKCKIIGVLIDAGVLRGNYNQLSKVLPEKEGKKAASLAEYMGKGKKEPYADWIIAYVNNG